MFEIVKILKENEQQTGLPEKDILIGNRKALGE